MKILAIGELLWDIMGDKAYIGGAPFNLASHASQLGMESYLVSAVGNDFLGKGIASCLESHNINSEFVNVVDYPTGAVNVTLGDNGIPTYTIHENVAWDNLSLSEAQFSSLLNKEWDVVCFGSLAQRNLSNFNLLKNILEKINCKHIFFDINLRQNYYSFEVLDYLLHRSSIVKINDEEALFLNRYLFDCDGTLKDFANRAMNKYNLNIMCITKGKDGAEIYHNNHIYDISGVKIKVADTVGAGDSFCAGFLKAFLSGQSLQSAGGFAVQIAGFVASKDGATPRYSEELITYINKACNK
ncbi:MAG: carbohydrate kinase [Burkholderiales bacterium]|nr:carbohydrate kinase [Burkholderiales bacterium]